MTEKASKDISTEDLLKIAPDLERCDAFRVNVVLQQMEHCNPKVTPSRKGTTFSGSAPAPWAVEQTEEAELAGQS